MERGDIFEEKYEIVKVLGKGGMGTVYLARNINTEALWAIKEVHKNGRLKFEAGAESNILKKLNHPALPRIFDIIENRENIYLITDYIEGISLDKRLEADRSIEENTVIGWAKDICDVLSYLHGQSPKPIIYRDMKPSNIILTVSGQIKLIDFGIAREYKDEAESDTVYIGTRGYAAPEQYGTGQTSPASDIYSLGVTLHNLLTGKSPNKPPYEKRPARYYNEALSPEIDRILEKCTMEKPEERYGSAEELLYDLTKMGQKQGEKSFFDANGGKGIKTGISRGIGKEEQIKSSVFKRLVLTFYWSHELACELMYVLGKMTGYSILLLNLDGGCPGVNFHLGIESRLTDGQKGGTEGLLRDGDSNFTDFLKSVEKGEAVEKSLKSGLLKINGLKNAYVLSEPSTNHIWDEKEGKGGNKEKYKDKYKEKYKEIYEEEKEYESSRNSMAGGIDYERLIGYAYRNFDITLVLVGRSTQKAAEKAAFLNPDRIIMTAEAHMAALLDCKSRQDSIIKQFKVSKEKFSFIAWEYKDGINIPKGLLNRAFDKGAFVGWVVHDPERERGRNVEGPSYIERAYKKHLEDYRRIAVSLGIPFKDGFNNGLRGKIGRLFLKGKGVQA